MALLTRSEGERIMSYTTDEKVDRRAELVEKLEDAVNALTSSDAYVKWLDSQVKFHSYSWSNQFLITAQCPHATFVRGFKQWLKLGRVVRKGEKGIFIWAFAGMSRDEVDEETGEHIQSGRPRFKPAAVFDVSQTEPLPDHPNPFDPAQASAKSWWVDCEAEGDDSACQSAYSALRDWYVAQGHVWTEVESLDGAHGSYHPRTHQITIATKRGCAPMLKTSIHEVTHYLTAQEVRKTDGAYDYDMGECVAESIAYVVCSFLGIEATTPSTQYIAYYIAQDRAAFLRALGFIAKRSHELIDVIEGALEGALSPELVEV